MMGVSRWLIGAALLCSVVHAEPVLDIKAEEIHEGDTGYIANNAIWFSDEEDLAVWNASAKSSHPRMSRHIKALF
jgi:hypothetical protein